MARDFRGAGWGVQHARYYTDSETGKQRECDIEASLTVAASEPAIRVSFAYVVECKQSRDKPWVVFATPADPGSPWLPSSLSVGLLSDCSLFCLPRERQGLLDILRPSDWIGHGVIRAFTDGRGNDPSAAYAAVRSAISAATALAAKHEDFSFMLGEKYIWPEVTVPMVVVDAPLFVYHLDDQGEEHLEEVSAVTTVAPHVGTDNRVLTPIVTAQALPDFLAAATPRVREMCGAIGEQGSLIRHMYSQRRAAASSGSRHGA